MDRFIQKPPISTKNIDSSFNLPSPTLSGRKIMYSKVVSGDLTFKSCVNFLHYCRLIYKHIAMMKNLVYYEQD